MRVTIQGPNLNREHQRQGGFHVHAADCRDNRKYAYLGTHGGWTVNVESVPEIVEEVYADQIAEGANFDDCAADFHIAPCCKELPR